VKTIKIFELRDPETHEVYTVLSTRKTIKSRMNTARRSGSRPLVVWLRMLRGRELEPEVCIVEEITDAEEVEEIRQAWIRQCQPLLLDDYMTDELRAHIDLWDREYPSQDVVDERNRQAQEKRELMASCLKLGLTEEEGKRYSAHAGSFYQSLFAQDLHDAKMAAYIQADLYFHGQQTLSQADLIWLYLASFDE
jgi:hypothetical protein